MSLCRCSIWRNLYCWDTIMHKIITSDIYILWELFFGFFAKLVTKNCFIFTKTYTFLYFLNMWDFIFFKWMLLTIICKKKISEKKYIALSLGSWEYSPSPIKSTYVRKFFQAKEKILLQNQNHYSSFGQYELQIEKQKWRKVLCKCHLCTILSTILYTLFRD